MYLYRKHFYRRLLPALIISVCLSAAACVTNTHWDALVYPSEIYASPLADNEEGLAMCVALEAEGYQFDEFFVKEVGLEILYPDGHLQRYPQSQDVNPVVIIDIDRDYDNPNLFSEDEDLRLEGEARSFCQDYQAIASHLDISLPLEGVFYWDYLDGVRGGFWLSETCEITGSYAWSAGSYANRYELNPSSVCPSGHVVH